MFKLVVLCVLYFAFAHGLPAPDRFVFEKEAQKLVNEINTANDLTWKAEVYPRFAQMSPDERKTFFSGLKVPSEKVLLARRNSVVNETPLKDEDLPENFNPADKWPKCADVFYDIRDQSMCGDCWAVSAAGAMSDRICAATDGALIVSISDIDTASCSMKGQDGCQGAADLSPAWKYYKKSGVVSGSNYTLQQGCKPYPFPPSDQATRDYRTPRCNNRCQRGYTTSYGDDRHYVESTIELQTKDQSKMEKLIMQEIYARGSVQVGFIVYRDFMYYKGGVYIHKSGGQEGGHAVRIIGWGVENGVKYWTIANSWGNSWGEKGTFRIRRGTDECGIESMVNPYAGVVKV